MIVWVCLKGQADTEFVIEPYNKGFNKKFEGLQK
jgi:hypothetical protein